MLTIMMAAIVIFFVIVIVILSMYRGELNSVKKSIVTHLPKVISLLDEVNKKLAESKNVVS